MISSRNVIEIPLSSCPYEVMWVTGHFGIDTNGMLITWLGTPSPRQQYNGIANANKRLKWRRRAEALHAEVPKFWNEPYLPDKQK